MRTLEDLSAALLNMRPCITRKVPHMTNTEAETAADRMRSQYPKFHFEAYLCGCGFYHVGKPGRKL